MPRTVRILLLTAAVLLLLAAPFALVGAQLEAWAPRALERVRRPEMMFGAVAAILAADILLPVPSSLVSTLAGSELGASWGTAASWLGMTVGAALGFGLARTFGRPLAARLASADDLAALAKLADRQGVLLIVGLRALPLLAEASVLMLGASGLPWRRFLPAAGLANLGIAVAYAWFGAYAREHQWLPAALAVALALPLLLTWSLRPVLRGAGDCERGRSSGDMAEGSTAGQEGR
jgi:uncharacterized membrane protein YdjX (TVP38/TMEM64 family)